MGYFSSGTEGMDYEQRVCSRCVHYPKGQDDRYCTVWELHVMWQRDSDCDELLDQLIPREGIYNGTCTMFYAKENEEHPDEWGLDTDEEGEARTDYMDFWN